MRKLSDPTLFREYATAFDFDNIFSSASFDALELYEMKQGEVLWEKNDTLDHLYFLVDGKIKIHTSSAEGNGLILRFKNPLAVIGDVEYVKGTDVFHTVESVTDGHLMKIPFARLRQEEKENTAFLHFLLEVITHKFYTEAHASTLNMLYNTDVRLASYLLSLTDDGKGSLFHEEMRPETLKETAEVIGTSYRHLNRVLRDFEDEGILEKHRGIIKITDIDLLRQKAEGNIYE
ncbi:Crp/Fnr family transcriptional regulator [Salimicrobium salexigens]|uniref:cAMP-binding domain of CRP or a regulatory subunit of cAMP-dependent protein kinases n=1 Tax=Salimicrobium salexigens TaxID=908941 RepID=A0ABY1KTV0_9BACI|nr:Crp/Fnr family transcriptional regulator [Salimicrobium salexigens]SIS76495.1 cAMP-binding domain of CRP or a regulatory subunit of cAMP-dependent protein kinases [Salimicrobium salexigens]